VQVAIRAETNPASGLLASQADVVAFSERSRSDKAGDRRVSSLVISEAFV